MTSPSKPATTATLSANNFRLWSDDPSAVDLLAFGAVADTVVDAVLDDALDPVALGVSGAWGSGKTTVLQLVDMALTSRGEQAVPRVLTVSTDPWRYDPTIGAKESLISDVLDRLSAEITATAGPEAEAMGALRKLAKRVDWSKALRMAARTSLTLQLPSADDLTDLIRTDKPDESGQTEPRGLEAFRDHFKELMESSELAHVGRVVVLVDDLDRCLPDTVVETLETIRLFLAVPKMSFVIAADEERVADAIRERYASTPSPRESGRPREEPAKLYLHKIVQTTIPLPALSRFDTEAYLLLLQLSNRLDDPDQMTSLIDQCSELRLRSADLDELPGVEGLDISAEMSFAARLTPLLYEKLRGNPRRIKRFLNDLHVRQAVAQRRGITLDAAIVAKLMVLEVLLPDGFKLVLDWLARNELRDQMRLLEATAGRVSMTGSETAATATVEPESPANELQDDPTDDSPDSAFHDDLLRWAKLPPAVSTIDLGPYLYLAAAFRGTALLDVGLPERLRDLASNLASSVRADQKSVTDDDLRGLTTADAVTLAEHLTRVIRDRPTEQRAAVVGLLRITRLHGKTIDKVGMLLGAIHPDDLQPATVLSFGPSDVVAFKSAIEGWADRVTRGPTETALKSVLDR